MDFATYGIGVTRLGRLLGHEGELLGYNTAMYSCPDAGVSITVMVNRYFGTLSVAGEIAVSLARLVSPACLPPGPTPPT
jgi:D-alanyl-D-alanine carboxypeptidase